MSRKVVCAFVAVLFAWLPSLSGQQLSDEAHKIRAALDETTKLEFIETALQDVIEYLEDRHGLQIELDSAALDAVGIGSDTPITRDLSGISLRSALRLMMRDLELTFIIQDEVLLITTKEVAQKEVSVRTYPVSDLAPHESVAEMLANSIETVLSIDEKSSARVSYFGTSMLVRGTEHQHYEVEKLLKGMRAAILKTHFPAYAELAPSIIPRRPNYSSSKIKTTWGVGKRTRYGVAGFIDLNGDGRSDREAILSLIKTTGGILDAEVTDEGVRKGGISIHTHYVLLGARPTDKSAETVRREYGRMLDEAHQFEVEVISAEKIYRVLLEHAAKEKAKAQQVKKGGADPFGGGADPFGKPARAPSGDPNPFGGGAKDKDPFGGSARPAPAGGEANPFNAKSKEKDPFKK